MIDSGRRGAAWLVGTPVEVWQVVLGLERDGSERRVARELGLSEHQVRVALEYWERHPERVEREPASNRTRDAGGR